MFVDSPELTHFGITGSPDVLDIVVLKEVTMVHQLTLVRELNSDHNSVLLYIGEERNGSGSEKQTITVS